MQVALTGLQGWSMSIPLSIQNVWKQGSGSAMSVRPVPSDENLIQGGIIAGAYLLEGISVGDEYVVVVIP